MLSASDIVCYIPVYNDAEALSRCLEKLKKMGINALVIDGRFEDFPQINGSDYSTDLTRDVCKHFGTHFEEKEPSREQDKFNLALKMAKWHGYKVFMYCGADAYFEADMPEFMLSLQRKYEQYAVEPTQLTVETEELVPDAKWNNTATRQPRIILNYWKMEARHLHWTMFEIDAPDTSPLRPIPDVLEGIKLYHDNTIRPQERDDLMTNYQNHNVERERQEFMDKIVPKAYEYLDILKWRIGVDGSYEEGRDLFLRKDGKHSHLLVVNEGYDADSEHIHKFENVLETRNNQMQQLPLITGVWKSKTVENHFTLNPDGDIEAKWPKYPKIQRLYSPDGLPNTEDPVLVAPFTAGPAVCMNRRVVALVEHMGDNLDFLAILMGLGIQIHADARIQF